MSIKFNIGPSFCWPTTITLDAPGYARTSRKRKFMNWDTPSPSVLGNGPGRRGGTRSGELRLRESGCESSVCRPPSAKSNFTTGSGEARLSLHTRRALSANRVDESIVLAHAQGLNRVILVRRPFEQSIISL